MTEPLGWTEPRDLPVEYIQPGDQVRVHTVEPLGALWADVITSLECDDPDCPAGGTCGGVIEYPATAVHYDALTTLPVRIPARMPAAAPVGPAPSERVYVTTARAGIPMHRMQADNRDSTACGRATRTGITLVAAEARAHWASEPCERCWPVTS